MAELVKKVEKKRGRGGGGRRAGGELKRGMALAGGRPADMPPVRTVRLRLLPTTAQERKLHKLADAAAKAWNEVNYLRRRQFFAKQGVDLRGTYREVYRRYRDVLKVNVGQVLNKNNEAWRSFFALLAKLKAGELPPHVKKVSPPGYWKDRLLGKRVKRLVVRSDRYYVESVNGGEGYIVLKDFGMRIRREDKVVWEAGPSRNCI